MTQPRPLAPPTPRKQPQQEGSIPSSTATPPPETAPKPQPRPLAPPAPRPRPPQNQTKYAAYHSDLVTQLGAAGLLGWLSPDAVGPPPADTEAEAKAVLTRVVGKHYPMIDWHAEVEVFTPDGDVFFCDYLEVLDELIGAVGHGVVCGADSRAATNLS